MLCVGVEQASDHPLILGVVLQGLTLEEVDTAFAQGERYLDSVIPEDEILRTRKEVGNNFKFSEGFVCVFDFRAHRFVFLFANNPLRKCELRRPGT